jgi:hypothetical protein
MPVSRRRLPPRRGESSFFCDHGDHLGRLTRLGLLGIVGIQLVLSLVCFALPIRPSLRLPRLQRPKSRGPRQRCPNSFCLLVASEVCDALSSGIDTIHFYWSTNPSVALRRALRCSRTRAAPATTGADAAARHALVTHRRFRLATRTLPAAC